jgi:hypothetical protein
MRPRTTSFVLLGALACATVALGARGEVAAWAQSATPPPPVKARDDAWREDIAFFAREFPVRQRDFAKLYPRDRFGRELDVITRAIPTATDAEVVLALMRLVASAHVGHTSLRWPTAGPLAFHRLPLGLQWYADGLAVTAASDPYREALGLRIVTIGSLPPEKLEAAVAPYVAYEHDGWLRQQSQTFMLIEEILRVLKQVDSDGRVPVMLTRPDGSTITIRVAPVPWQDRTPLVTAVKAFGIPIGPPHIEPHRYYRYEVLPGTSVLYIRYSRCAEDPQQRFVDFAKDMFAVVDSAPMAVERVVIDLRANGGGDSRVISPLLRGLRDRRPLRARGRLLALVGPDTFSSGLLAAINLREDLNALIIGDTPGENLNSYGEVRPLTLPNSRLVLQYSTKFFELAKSDTAVFTPDVVVRPTIGDWLAGRDPVLDAAVKAPRSK